MYGSSLMGGQAPDGLVFRGAGSYIMNSMGPVDMLDRLERCEMELGRLRQITPRQGQQALPPLPGTVPDDDTPVRKAGAPSTQEYQDLMKSYNQLVKAHSDLAKAHSALLLSKPAAPQAAAAPAPLKASGTKPTPHGVAKTACPGKQAKAGVQAPALGVIRLDYDYPPAPGDVDSPASYAYDVYFRVVPGLTFSMCQSGKLTFDVTNELISAVHWLVVQKKVSFITGDCGFMMWLQPLVRQHTRIPVGMSSLCQLPAITAAFGPREKIAIFTANSETLKPMRDLIKDECGVDPEEHRFIMVGCQDVKGFEAVALGEKVDVEKVTPGVVAKAMATLNKNPDIRAIVLECTELPPYSDALRLATGLPVYDAITSANMYMAGRQDNPLFGVNDWEQSWDGVQDAYTYGAHLDGAQKAKLVNKVK